MFSRIFEGGPCFLENLRGGSVFSKVYEGGPCFRKGPGSVFSQGPGSGPGPGYTVRQDCLIDICLLFKRRKIKIFINC